MRTHQRVAWWALLAAFGFQIALGYSIAFAMDTDLWTWNQERVAMSLWGDPTYPPEAAALRAFSSGVMGGTIAGFAVAALWITAVPLRRGERWAWWAIATAFLAWFWADTLLSVSHAVWVNVVFNVVALATVAVPLAVLWPWVRARSPDPS